MNQGGDGPEDAKAQAQRKAAMEDELDQRLEAEREKKVRELFHRLDIPLEDIPVSSLLPWKSFQPLLDSHFGPSGLSKTPQPRRRGEHQGSKPTVDSSSSGRVGARAQKLPQSRRTLFSGRHGGGVESSKAKSLAAGDATATAVQQQQQQVDLPSSSVYNHQLHNLADLHSNSLDHHEREYITIETTLHDMGLIARRIDGISKALNLGKPFRRITSTSIEDDPITDPELLKIHHLEQQLHRVASDVAGHVNHIDRLHQEMKRKDQVIASLHRELEEERRERTSGYGGENGGDDDDDRSHESANGVPHGDVSDGGDGALGGGGGGGGSESNSSFTTETVSAPAATTARWNPRTDDPFTEGPAEHHASPSNFPMPPARRGVTVRQQQRLYHDDSPASGVISTKVMDALVHPRLAAIGQATRHRLAMALHLYRSLLVEDPDTLDALFSSSGPSGGGAVSSQQEQQRRRGAAFVQNDVLQDLFSLVPQLRVVPPPSFAVSKLLAPVHVYLAVGIPQQGAQSTETPLDPHVWSSLLTQTYAYIETVILRHGGTLASAVYGKQTAVFADPVAATQCALEIQVELPITPHISYPATLDTALETAKNPHAQHPKYIWRGYRPVITMDLSPTGFQDCSRDVVGSGSVIYSGDDVHRTRWVACNYPYGGITLVSDRMRHSIETNEIELEEPLTMFWQWQKVPGESKAVPYFAVFHRLHHTRVSELQHVLRHHYTEFQYHVLTDPDNPATLERLVSVNNKHAARHGAKVVSKEDESILGVEGPTVEHRLKSLRTIPALAATSNEIAGGGGEFLAHLPELDNSSSDAVPSGDQTLILFSLPCYHQLVEVLDDSAAQTVYRRAAKVVRDTFTEATNNSIVEVRASREKILLACSDPVDALKMCFAAQQKLLNVQWPKDMNELAGVVGREERWHGTVVDAGPASSFCLHFTKVKALRDAIGDGTTYYQAQDMDMMLHLSASAPESVSSIIMSEIVFALVRQRLDEFDDFPFVECAGLIAREGKRQQHQKQKENQKDGGSNSIGAAEGGSGGDFLSPVFSITPRPLVGRNVLYPSALWSLQKDRCAFKYAKRSRLTQAMMVKVLAERFERGSRKLPKALRDAHKRYLLEQDKSIQSGSIRARVESMTSSPTITATKTQSAAASTFFEWSKLRSQLEGIQLTLCQMIRQSDKTADGEALRAMECVLMQHEDAMLPSVLPLYTVRAEGDTLVELLQVMQGKGARLRRDSVGTTKSVVLKRRLSATVSINLQASINNKVGQWSGPQQHHHLHHQQHLLLQPGAAAVAQPHPVLIASSPSGNFPPTSLSSSPFVSGSEALAMLEIDKERKYLMRRSRSMETEVMCTHMISQQFHKLIKAYLAALMDNSQPIVPSEEFVLRFMQKVLAVRGRQKKLMGNDDEDNDDDDPNNSSGSEVISDDDDPATPGGGISRPFEIKKDGLPHVNISTAWNDVLMQLVDLKDGELSDYDPILLCRSLVAQLAHQFLFLRNVANRFSRTSEQLEMTRQMDPSTKMGRAVRAAVAMNRMQRLEEGEAVRSATASFVSLPDAQA